MRLHGMCIGLALLDMDLYLEDTMDDDDDDDDGEML